MVMKMNSETILSFIQSHILEIGLILAIIFVLRNWGLIVVAVLIVIGLSYFGILDSENIKEFIINLADNLRNSITVQ